LPLPSDTGSFGTKKRLRAIDYQFGGYRSFSPAFGRPMVYSHHQGWKRA